MDGNTDGSLTQNEDKELELTQAGPLDLELDDEEVNSVIGKRVENGKIFWNKELDLDKSRELVEKNWLNTALDINKLYDFQVPYKNNRIFSAIETLIPIVLTNAPQPLVTQASDSEASYELAQNIQTILLALYEDLYLKNKLSMVARHLLVGYRFGAIKYRWDANRGILGEDGERKGGIVVECVRPTKLVIDAGATELDDIPLIAEYLDCTKEELTIKFPEKKEEIIQKFGGTQEYERNKNSRIQYLEVWFTYYKDGKRGEGVCHKYQDLVLDKMKNPHWNYDEQKKNEEGKSVLMNFLDRPQKPYIIFNYLNLGKYVIDDTSLTEQAIPLQDVLNKRGRQIVENADQANSGTIYNEEMISQEDVAKITGDPRESVMVKGPVNQAASRLPINLLPDYVIADKNDARAEIDNIYGTNAPIRGEASNAKTLGQEVISQRSNMSRLQTLADAIEDGSDRLYKGLVQMMKVFWDEPTMVKYTGEDGKTTFLEFSQDKIEDGIAVRVKAGSVLPKDKETTRQITMKLAPILDPLSLAKGLDDDNPKEFAKRMMLFKLSPQQYMEQYLGDSNTTGSDPRAVADLKTLLSGQPVQPPEDVSKDYLSTFNNFMNTPEFQKLQPELQQAIIEFVKMAMAKAKQGLGIEGTQEAQTPEPTADASAPEGQVPMEGQPQAAPMQEPPPQATMGF